MYVNYSILKENTFNRVKNPRIQNISITISFYSVYQISMNKQLH